MNEINFFVFDLDYISKERDEIKNLKKASIKPYFAINILKIFY